MAVPLIAAGIGLLGSAISANAQRQAANRAADAQIEAARIAAEESRFRPVGVTTAFGSSQFGFDPQGRLTSAGYTLSPQMAAARDRLLSQATGAGLDMAEQGLTAGQGLFNLGQGYLAETPEQAAQQYMARQQDLLAPSRERTLAGLRTNLFNTGRTGLSVGATGARPGGGAGLGATNPELEAYYNALAQQDAQLAAESMAQGREQVRFGSGLLSGALGLQSAAYDPFRTQLGLGSNIEQLGQGALGLGSELGGRVTSANQVAASGMLNAGRTAALTRLEANPGSVVGGALSGAAANEKLMRGLGSWFSGLNTPAPTTMYTNAYGGFTPAGGFDEYAYMP